MINVDEEINNLIRVKHDVVVIGAGGAGLRAAIAAAHEGATVAVVTKSLLGKAHTVMAEGGAAAALGNTDPRDNWKVHFRDTMRGGKLHNNWKMVKIFTQQAPDRIRELELWGAVFDRTKDGRISQRPFGGHQYPRLAHVGDRTGLELIRTLQDKAVHEENIDIFAEHTVVRIIKNGDKIVGAIGYRRSDGKLILFETKAIVLATGGLGKAYRITSNSWEYTGDGLAMALDVGAELIDMEFLQFHPTGMIYPPSVKGTLVTEGVRGEGGVLYNSEGERFMFRYIPKMFEGEYATTPEEADRWVLGDPDARRPPELLTRDVVAKAILSEVKAGRGSPHGGAFLDIASKRPAEYIKRKLPSMYHQFKTLAGVDITKDPMEVGPTLHYAMGGIRVDPETQMTTVPGLFAAGEVAGGLHGANRLGGNSLTDLLVFGNLAGMHAAKYAKGIKEDPKVPDNLLKEVVKEILGPFDSDRTEDPYALHNELRALMEEHVGMIRDGENIKKGIEKLKELRERVKKAGAKQGRVYNPSWHEALDLVSLVNVGLAVAYAALAREESRGAHTRTDFPESKPELVRKLYIISKDENGEIQVKEEEYPEMPEDLQRIIDQQEE